MDFSGWYPVALQEKEQPLIKWTYFGDQRFTRPFFYDEQTGKPYQWQPFDSLLQASYQEIVSPAAFFFHSSRCGSTLLSQQLSLSERFISLSEPTGLDLILHYVHDLDNQDEQIALIRTMVQILGQKRFDRESHLFIKTDSWHIAWLPLIRQAYPEVPCYFMFREPEAIIASHQKLRGRQMVPGVVDMKAVQPDLSQVEPWDLDRYAQQVLLRFFELAIQYHKQGLLTLIDYNTLPDYIWHDLNTELNLQFTLKEMNIMRQASGNHSKRPDQLFHEKKASDIQIIPELSACYQQLKQCNAIDSKA
ncbi:hypothetical protein [Oceanospirillum sediminis]|uniref:DUSP domain-containing protein n=1 Tax=Oceanospirillum sediminis TaxID=2760088 RepID=A0A839IMJ8_9GAMM|nr:hypothetical protein [Oceanospirillum sediminis]MBB1485526.1 hypothetical protein [Oceanospirillum sediminis]